ncbi:7806_t:CDS:2 [Dentiscutata heterogama]|uniref:7806_t:CDS:1 n=1 Tax=Dentiscutata heterogama TaxID=1316150 RepID=A0ACA9K7A2_9GLOM|nr:7806_t:CDS:2 [Dentiscutata heterogama]
MPKQNKHSQHCTKAIKKQWKKDDDNEISDYESNNAGNETFLEALQSLRPEVFEKLIEKLSFDDDTKFLSNEYEELLSNENDEFSSNENNEFSSNIDTKLSSKENNELSSDANTELSSKENNKCLFYMNDDEVNDMNNCNKLYNELSYDEVINSSDEDENNEFSLEALDSLIKENSFDIRLRTWLSKGEISTSRYGCHVKTKSLLSHEDFKSNITQNLHANKFKITPKQFTIGLLCLSQEEKEANNLLLNNERLPYTDACIIVYPGLNQDGCCNHNSFAKDALLVSRINMKDGGKRPLLCNGRMHNGSIHIMTFVDQDNKLKPKGIKCVLQECGLWVLGLTRERDGCKAGASTNLQYCATNILKS